MSSIGRKFRLRTLRLMSDFFGQTKCRQMLCFHQNFSRDSPKLRPPFLRILLMLPLNEFCSKLKQFRNYFFPKLSVEPWATAHRVTRCTDATPGSAGSRPVSVLPVCSLREVKSGFGMHFLIPRKLKMLNTCFSLLKPSYCFRG